MVLLCKITAVSVSFSLQKKKKNWWFSSFCRKTVGTKPIVIYLFLNKISFWTLDRVYYYYTMSAGRARKRQATDSREPSAAAVDPRESAAEDSDSDIDEQNVSAVIGASSSSSSVDSQVVDLSVSELSSASGSEGAKLKMTPAKASSGVWMHFSVDVDDSDYCNSLQFTSST